MTTTMMTTEPFMATNAGLPAFRSVLLATDFSAASESAFEAGLDVCLKLGAKLNLLHVFEYADAVPPESGGELINLEGLLAEARAKLTRLTEAAEKAGVACDAILDGGVPSMTILETLRERKFDLAVLGTSAFRGLERLVFGSTSESVLRKAPCPVLTVGPRVGSVALRTEGPVVFATDFHCATIHAMRYAAAMAKKLNAPLECLHVLPRSVEGGPRSRVIPQIMTEAMQHFALDVGATTEPPVCAVTYGSEISNTIVDYARKQGARMVVLGVRQASLLGSHGPAPISYRVIAEAGCPVLTVSFDQKTAARLEADGCEHFAN